MAVSEREEEEDCKEQQSAYYGKEVLDKKNITLQMMLKGYVRSYKTARAPQIPTKVKEDSESLVSYQRNNGKTCAPMAVSEREEEEDCKEQQSAYYGKEILELYIAARRILEDISEKQKELGSRVQSCQEKLESCEELLRKTQSETRLSLQQISTGIQQSKPLTKREVLNLVQEITEQPKLVEKEALRLTEDLNQKIQKFEHLLHEVKKLITG
ncbi:ARID DNA-binding domain-containing protein [Tanacetum coccineum]